MRFYEYESRQILQREGIPVADGGFARSAEEAKAIAADVGGPVVIKSQVLTGGRMKAGGVKFADSPGRPRRRPSRSSSSRSTATCRAAYSWARRRRSSRSTTRAG